MQWRRDAATTCGRSQPDQAAPERAFWQGAHYTWRTNSSKALGACTTRWQWPEGNLLDHYRAHRFSLFLPGQQDWSTTFQLLMSLGGALLVPRDSRTRTLWSEALAAHCDGCMLRYERGGDVCQGLAAAVAVPAEEARRAAESLDSFVRSELNADCVSAYMQAVLSRLRPPPTQMSERELRALGFHRFDCHMQKELVWRLRSPRLGPYPSWHHEAWYYPETCVRRLVPQPLPWARCAQLGGSHLSDPLRLTGPSDDPPTRLAWC